jgi:Icc-related predicted phosphoesterase
MKILVVGDCHGVKPDIEEEVGDADLILATGDICGDSDEVRNAMFQAMDSEKMWYDVLGREEAKKAVEKSIAEGREVLEHLNSFGKPVFLVPGNWDWTGEENQWEFMEENRFRELVEEFQNIHNIDREVFRTSGLSFIGYGPCPAPEFPQYEDDMPEDPEELEEMKKEYRERKEELEEIFESAADPVIFLSHNVPNDTSLDKIENPDSPAEGRHYGSLVVRDFIEDFQPVFSAAGHIHEGYGVEDIGDTVALNAGLYGFVTVEIESEEVEDLGFYPAEER